MKRLLALLAIVLSSLPAQAEEAQPGLKISERAWRSAWLARKRVKESGEALGAARAAEMKKEGDDLLRLKKRLVAGTHPLAKKLREAEAELAELEKKAGEVLSKIRAYGDVAAHERGELKALMDEHELAYRRLRDRRIYLELDVRPRVRRALDDFRARCEGFSRHVTDAFLERGMIRRFEFDKWSKELMRRQDYSPDVLGHTHCNAFVHDFAGTAFGYEGLRGKSANTIADFLKEGKGGWTAVWEGTPVVGLQDGLRKAQELANAGHLVLAVWRAPAGSDARGHVAVVLPGELKKSALWGLDVPDTAQAGRIVFERGPLPVGFEEHRDILVYVRKP